VINESTIRKAIAQQRAHNQATDASIAELRAELNSKFGMTRRLCIVAVLLITVLQAAAVLIISGKARHTGFEL
jgi:hypothetical protein